MSTNVNELVKVPDHKKSSEEDRDEPSESHTVFHHDCKGRCNPWHHLSVRLVIGRPPGGDVRSSSRARDLRQTPAEGASKQAHRETLPTSREGRANPPSDRLTSTKEFAAIVALRICNPILSEIYFRAKKFKGGYFYLIQWCCSPAPPSGH